MHHRLGAHPARRQAEVALGALVGRPDGDGRALAGEPVWSERMVLRSLQALPVTFPARREAPAYG